MRPEQIRRAYALYAPVYDRVFGLVFQQGRRATIDRLNAQPGERVLEVGVGTGLMLPLYPRHSRITGVDLSAEMLAKAQRRAAAQGMDHVELRLMDASRLQFPDGSFDAVIAAYVVTAVPDYRAVLDEMIRVCRPGGRLILTNHFANGTAVLGRLERVTSPLFEYAGFRTDLTVEDVVEGTGLEVREVRRLNAFGLWRTVVCVKPAAV